MPLQNPPPHRKNIRLKGYDYRLPGAYFITICTHNRECIFGDLINGEMHLNDFGRIVQDEWLKSAAIRREIVLDEFVIMPNHIHAVLFIVDGFFGGVRQNDCRGVRQNDCRGVRQNDCTGVRRDAPTHTAPGAHTVRAGPPSKSIGAFMAGFKSAVTKQINALRNAPGAPLWLRNYYDHIIRNDEELDRIRQYIQSNPQRWAEDENNPAN